MLLRTFISMSLLLLIFTASLAVDDARLQNIYGYEIAGFDELDEISIPSDFLTYNITDNGGTHDGYTYFSLWSWNYWEMNMRGYSVILNHDNEVVFFNKGDGFETWGNFQPHPHVNKFTYWTGDVNFPGHLVILDETFTPIDSLENERGTLIIDGHEVLLLEDGTMWLEYYDPREIDMSEIVEGGLEDALVMGHAFLHVDADENILWEWYSLDHLDELPLTEGDDPDELTTESFEHLHTNSLQIANDGNLIVSNRHTSTCLKISMETGEIMWEFGGGLGNQFTFEGTYDEPLDFHNQHDFRQLPNGNYTLFDNGNGHDSTMSYAREYELDEENLIANLVWVTRNEPATFGPMTGNAQRLDNGNTLIAWGGFSPIGATEVNTAGDVLWQFEADQDTLIPGALPVWSYRFYKSDMMGIAAAPYICEVVNDNDLELYFNFFGNEADVVSYNLYMGTAPEPTEIHANLTSNAYAIEDLEYGSPLYFRITALDSEGNESGFSNEIEVIAVENDVKEENSSRPMDYAITNVWPNPFNSTANVKVNLNRRQNIQLKVYDVLGREIATLHQGLLAGGEHSFSFEGEKVASGVYFLRLQSDSGESQMRKMILLR